MEKVVRRTSKNQSNSPQLTPYQQPLKSPQLPEGISEEAYICQYDPTQPPQFRTGSDGQLLRRQRVIAVPKSGSSSESTKKKSKSKAKRVFSAPVLQGSHTDETESESEEQLQVLSWVEEEPVTNYHSPLLASKGVRINNIQVLGRFLMLAVLSFIVVFFAIALVSYLLITDTGSEAVPVLTGFIGTVFGVWVPTPKVPKSKNLHEPISEKDSSNFHPDQNNALDIV